jgi:hypothetical protein
MRERPKLSAVIARLIRADHAPHGFVEALDAEGYVIIEKATRRREQRRFDIAENERHYAEREAEGTRRWGETMAQEAQRLRDRCSFLYEKATEHGATREELVGGPAEVPTFSEHSFEPPAVNGGSGA